MRGAKNDDPMDRGEVVLTGRCQICGQTGRVLALPGAPEPNQFCPKCAIEYGASLTGGDDEGIGY